MRSILSLSLPKQMDDKISAEVKKGAYASKSEFVRSLIREWMDEEFKNEIAESKRELGMGKGKLLKSLSDLR